MLDKCNKAFFKRDIIKHKKIYISYHRHKFRGKMTRGETTKGVG